MIVRKAEVNDIPQILELLSQVLEVHAAIRPDLFISGTVKYGADELEKIILDENSPVFVAQNDGGRIIGHAFTQININTSQNMPLGMKSMYIDDICVDENARRMSAGRKLYKHCVKFAKEIGCYDISLNVWEGNDSARGFYDSMGMRVRKTTLEYILE